MIYGKTGDIIKIERIKFPDGTIDPRDCHYGIIIASDFDLYSFLLLTHKKQRENGTYYRLSGDEFRNNKSIKKHVDTYIRFQEEFETNRYLEIVGKVKRDDILIKILKAYRKYINTHEQVVVNINSKENPLVRKL